MKKIIGGKRYDTATAKQLGSASSDVGRNDFRYWQEDLYQKKTGEFFLHGEGGGMSRYAVSCGGGSFMGGEKLIPMSYEEARSWAEKHLEASDYEQIFVVEDETKKTLCLSLQASTIERLKKKSLKRGITVSEYIEKEVAK